MEPAPRSRGPRGARTLAALAALAVFPGCSSCSESARPEESPDAGAPAAEAPPAPRDPRLLDLTELLPRCDVSHRGLLLDLGENFAVGRFGFAAPKPAGVTLVEHGGAGWARLSSRLVDLSFVLTEASPVFVSARLRGFASKSATVLVDGQVLGTMRFSKDEIRVAQTPQSTLPLDPGMHTLTLRFAGRASDKDPFAEVDWVRLGVPDEIDQTYGPPTLRDVLAPSASLSGVPHRSVALRAPASVRCPVRAAPGARLSVSLGLLGSGEGKAELRLLRDGHEPETLHRATLAGGEEATWKDAVLPIDLRPGELAHVELLAAEAPKGSRILFGDPAIVGPAGEAGRPGTRPVPTRSFPEAQLAVLVFMSGLERDRLPGYGGAPVAPDGSPRLPSLAALAKESAVFLGHRAPSTVVAASVASALTGLAPEVHGLVDTGARLPEGRAHAGTVTRDASLGAAMFTGVPKTFRAFGFGAAFSPFVEHAPQSGDPATAPLESAASWIVQTVEKYPTRKLLAVVHTRGAHPPWDVPPRALEKAPPDNYAGLVDPRRAAQVLARFRQRRRRSPLPEADRTRALALEAIGLAGQDRALGALVETLRGAGLWEKTLFIVTGDVSSGSSDDALFGDGLPPTEPRLSLPLYVSFPGGAHAGARVVAPTEVYDVGRTALLSLGLDLPKDARGRSLADVTKGSAEPYLSPQIARVGDRYAIRWGDFVLTGRSPGAPSLCVLSLDPTCAVSRREVLPLATQSLFRAYAFHVETSAPAPREPASLDEETQSALSVWGLDEREE